MLKPPVDDEYTFHIQTDAAVAVFVNNQNILDHRLSDHRVGHKGADFGDKVSTTPISLSSKFMYKILIKYARSNFY